MAGKKFTGQDKTVIKMTRKGLTEERLTDGSVKNISHRIRERPVKKETEEVLDQERNLNLPVEETVKNNGKKTSVRKFSAKQKDVTEIHLPENILTGKQKKLREHVFVSDPDQLSRQKKRIKRKQIHQKSMREQKRAGKLSFDDESPQMAKSFGMKPGRAAGKYIAKSVLSEASKEEEKEEPDVFVETGQLAERGIKTFTQGLRYAQYRIKRLDAKRHQRGFCPDFDEQKLKFETSSSKAKSNTTEGIKKSTERSRVQNHYFQKKRYKDAYRGGKAGRSAAQTGNSNIFTATENVTEKAKSVLKEIVSRNRVIFSGIGIFFVLLLVLIVSLGSCSISIQGGGSVIQITTYPGTDEELYAAENYYVALEEALNQQMNEMETTHPNYDEYQYNISEIAHNPYHLISYLTAKYGDWKFEDVKEEIRALFESQYDLNTESRTETTTETNIVRVGESLGNVVTSGYCSCAVCCGPWAGGPTASGVYPTADHTIAVDAFSPFVPIGTKVVMNGVEYTVEDTGAFARYGVDFDVYYSDHTSALAHGHRTWEAFLADDNGNSEVEVTQTTTKKILYVTLENSGFDAVARTNLNEEQLILYDALNLTYGNRSYLWDVEHISSGNGEDGMSYEIPPEALQDEEFARMIREAEKYLGVPYVWGGYSPSGFDCSGFVSYVINHCGNGWNMGRQTAEGLRNQCTFVSPENAKPGDLIFFQGTYSTPGASHVGIYVGNNMMIHCGDPIQYSNIGTGYWQQHFMCYGRLP